MIVCKVCAFGIHKRVLAPSSLQIMSFTGVDSISSTLYCHQCLRKFRGEKIRSRFIFSRAESIGLSKHSH
jgi:hypothetical protein